MKRSPRLLYALVLQMSCLWVGRAQIDVERVMSIGRNALHFKDYVVSIGHFNQVIATRDWLAEPYFFRAVAKISLEDYEGAELDASEALKRNPFLSKAYLLRGVARQNLSHHKEAIQDYRAGLDLMPADQGMRYNLALAQLEIKEYEASTKTVDTLERFGYGMQEILQLRTRLALGQGDTIEAKRINSQLLERDPLYTPAHLMQAQLAMQALDYASADRALSEAIRGLRSPQANLYTNRAICRYHLNNLRGAMADYSQALELEPTDRVARNNRALLRISVGEYQQALEDWSAIVAREPANQMARYNKALLHSRLGQPREALRELDSVLYQHPTFEAGFAQRAQLRQLVGDTRGAQRDRLHLYDLQQNKSYQRANAQAGQQRRPGKETRSEQDLAIEKYNLLIEGKLDGATADRPNYASGHRGEVQNRNAAITPIGYFDLSYFDFLEETRIGNATFYVRQLDAVNHQLPVGIRLHLSTRGKQLEQQQVDSVYSILGDMPESSSHPRAALVRAIGFSLLRDLDEAERFYNLAIERDPEHPIAYIGRAVAQLRRQEAKLIQKQESKQEESKTATPKPSLPPKRDLILSANDPLADLNRVIALAPDMEYAYYNRAVLQTSLQEYAKAIDDYTEAIKHNPKLAEAYYNRGLLYLSSGQTAKAIEDIRRAGELGLYEAYSIIKRIR